MRYSVSSICSQSVRNSGVWGTLSREKVGFRMSGRTQLRGRTDASVKFSDSYSPSNDSNSFVSQVLCAVSRSISPVYLMDCPSAFLPHNIYFAIISSSFSVGVKRSWLKYYWANCARSSWETSEKSKLSLFATIGPPSYVFLFIL